jgi:GntR family transcriptional regulator
MPLPIELDYDSDVPIYRQIVEAVIAAVHSKRLAADEQLPTIHELARRLDVNPNTIIRAYRDLEHGGYVISERGKGTFSNGKAPAGPTRKKVLERICQRALAEADRYGISGPELLEHLKKELS